MPATRKGKSEPAEKEASVRKSPRKRNISKETEVTDKTPKRTRRKAIPKEFDESGSELFNTPSTSFGSNNVRNGKIYENGTLYDNGNVCSFYRTSTTPTGLRTFHKNLIKYFMKIDSPEMADLKAKKFNTSFLRETPRSKDSLKIFTEEEDNDKKWLDNVPDLGDKKKDLPEVPGSAHVNVFASLPLGCIGDSDEEFKITPPKKNKKRKSVRCTEFKGKPLPDHSLLVDYSSVLDFEPNCDDDDKEHEENKDAAKNNNGILYSLLSSPTNRPVTYGKDILVSTKEDEMLFNKYKDILSNKKVCVVLTKLPIDSHLLQLNAKESVTAKPAVEIKEKKKVSNAKKIANEKVKVSKLELPKRQKRKNDNTKSKA